MVGIVLVIAVPAYRDYAARGAVLTFLSEAKHVFDAVEAFRNDKSAMPTSNQMLGFPEDLKTANLSAIEVGDAGTVTVTFAQTIRGSSGSTLLLEPIVGGAGVGWRSVGGTLKENLRPREWRHSD